MKTIRQTYSIHAPSSLVWKALVDREMIEKWGGGAAKMDDERGTKFSLWDGEIWGVNKEVIKEKKLIQEWHDDKDEDNMIVTFTLVNEGDKTIVTLLHENVPDKKYKSLSQGWKDYYLGPLQTFLEHSPGP